MILKLGTQDFKSMSGEESDKQNKEFCSKIIKDINEIIKTSNQLKKDEQECDVMNEI